MITKCPGCECFHDGPLGAGWSSLMKGSWVAEVPESQIFFQQTWKLVIWNMMQDCRFCWNMTSLPQKSNVKSENDGFLFFWKLPENLPSSGFQPLFCLLRFLRQTSTNTCFISYDCNSQKIRHTSKKIRLQSLIFFENNLIESNQKSINQSIYANLFDIKYLSICFGLSFKLWELWVIT